MTKKAKGAAAGGNGESESGSSTPKFTIRVALAWVIPVASVVMGCGLVMPFVLAGILTPIELPKLRQRIFGRLRKQLPCMRAPALMRLAVLWLLQAWWVILWRAEMGFSNVEADASNAGNGGSLSEGSSSLGDAASDVPSGTDTGNTAVERGGPAAVPHPRLSWTPSTMSVVLPCAGEGEYALNTVRSVFETTPSEVLREIIVVDDGTEPPLSKSHLTEDVLSRYRVRLLRHQSTVGLIGTKKDGGDVAEGDVIVFLDCHVAPQPGWHASFLRLMAVNYRRIVVPVITDLDVSTWKQRGGGGMAKCYLTWDADFKWFESDDEYVPVVSGGLLGISKRWWNETGGYDEHMVGWGGENLDQSLRSWLCGGEIVIAKDAFIAHMWRKPDDPRTQAKYVVKPGSQQANRMRAAKAWFGEFSEKLDSFPLLSMPGRTKPDGSAWYGDISNILEVKSRLQCKSFAWFMHRFRHVYEDGGLLPQETFSILAKSPNQCLRFMGQPGTSPDGRGKASLTPCNPSDERQRWHLANRDVSKTGKPCCNGLRAWNTDQCISSVSGGHISTFVCDISGRTSQQHWSLSVDGQLSSASGFMRKNCVVPFTGPSGTVALHEEVCGASTKDVWSKDVPEEPVEWRLYRRAQEAEQEDNGLLHAV